MDENIDLDNNNSSETEQQQQNQQDPRYVCSDCYTQHYATVFEKHKKFAKKR